MSRLVFNRVAWLQGLTLLALILPIAGAGLYVWDRTQRVNVLLSDIEPRFARLQGLLLREGDLKAATSKADELLSQLTYPAAQDATLAGNDAQQRIRNLFSESKLDVVSIQVIPQAKDEKAQFDRIRINLRVEGDLGAIREALSRLSGQTPKVQIENMSIQTIGAVKPASNQRLAGQFDFYVLRRRS